MIEKYSILDISEEEHKLVVTAREKYGEVFDTAHELVKFLTNFMESINRETYVFMSFLSLARKSLLLALLSTVRMHQVQTQMNIRQALEAGVKGAYALAFPDPERFAVKREDGTLEEKEDLVRCCYQWLEENYIEESNAIKALKKSINELFAHANIITTQNITEFSNEKYLTTVFDKEDSLMVKSSLWLVANVSFGLINLFAKISLKTKNIKLAPDFVRRISEYRNATENIKRQLMAEPRFSRFYR